MMLLLEIKSLLLTGKSTDDHDNDQFDEESGEIKLPKDMLEYKKDYFF